MAPMDARSRVRQFLARGTADRPPFLAMATEYTAMLAQCTVGELLADPGLFVRSFSESVAVLGLEAVLIEIPAAVAVGGDPAASGCAVLGEDLYRLRATLRDQLAMVVLLPGPLTLSASLGLPATTDSLDDLVTTLITLAGIPRPRRPRRPRPAGAGSGSRRGRPSPGRRHSGLLECSPLLLPSLSPDRRPGHPPAGRRRADRGRRLVRRHRG